MKKKVLLVIVLSVFLIVSACCSNNRPPYSLKAGSYGLKKVIATNIVTKDMVEISVDDILDGDAEYEQWEKLLSFSVGINESTEYFFKEDNRCFVLNEGLAFEVVGENELKLHFPYWQGNDYKVYDIVIILAWRMTYC